MKLAVSITFSIPQDKITPETFRLFRDELRGLLHKYFPGWDIQKECPIKLEWISVKEFPSSPL